MLNNDISSPWMNQEEDYYNRLQQAYARAAGIGLPGNPAYKAGLAEEWQGKIPALQSSYNLQLANKDPMEEIKRMLTQLVPLLRQYSQPQNNKTASLEAILGMMGRR